MDCIERRPATVNARPQPEKFLAGRLAATARAGSASRGSSRGTGSLRAIALSATCCLERLYL